jgi:hypothetical protein
VIAIKGRRFKRAKARSEDELAEADGFEEMRGLPISAA